MGYVLDSSRTFKVLILESIIFNSRKILCGTQCAEPIHHIDRTVLVLKAFLFMLIA